MFFKAASRFEWRRQLNIYRPWIIETETSLWNELRQPRKNSSRLSAEKVQQMT